MNSRKKIIDELRFQLNCKEVKDQHYPVQLSASDANAILAMLKEQEPKTIHGFADTIEGVVIGNCPRCDRLIVGKESDPTRFCKYCGQAVIFE